MLVTIALAALAAHGVAVGIPFQFDDVHQIADNPALREPGSLPRFFTDPWIGSSTGHVFFYRPLLFMTFLVDGMIGGGSPVPYRITSLALLIVYAVVGAHFTGAILPRLLPGASPDRVTQAGWLAALLVAVHPLLNETVLLASSRSSLLMAVFGLGALTLLAGGHSSARVGAGVTLTVLALLTKETAVALAPLAVLVAFLAGGGQRHLERLRRAVPIVTVVALYVAFYLMARSVGPLSEPPPTEFPASLVRDVPLLGRPTQGGLALLGLARLLVLPIGLSLSHEVPVPSGPILGLAVLLWPLALVACALLLRRGSVQGLIGFAALWFALALAPFVLAGLNTPMAEHRVALALAGPAAVGGWALASLEAGWVKRGLVAGLVGVLAAASLVQALPWRTPLRLWTREVQLHPQSARAWSFLASASRNAGDLSRAREAIGRALQDSPRHVIYLTQAAGVEMVAGDLGRVGELTRAGLVVEPEHVPLLLLETERLARVGQLDDALRYAQRATQVAQGSSAAWNALGNVRFLRGERAAVLAYRRAVELDPANAEAAHNLRMATDRWPE
jgi:tetratricopeptide (TPR) repeat protein